MLPCFDGSELTYRMGCRIAPHLGHFLPGCAAAFEALSANVCCLAIAVPLFDYEILQNTRTELPPDSAALLRTAIVLPNNSSFFIPSSAPHTPMLIVMEKLFPSRLMTWL